MSARRFRHRWLDEGEAPGGGRAVRCSFCGRWGVQARPNGRVVLYRRRRPGPCFGSGLRVEFVMPTEA